MRQLNFDLKTLQAKHRDGAFITRRDCAYALNQAANLLHTLGFRRLRATGIKRKHVNALVAEWQRRGLAVGTVRTACRRFAGGPSGSGARGLAEAAPDLGPMLSYA